MPSNNSHYQKVLRNWVSLFCECHTCSNNWKWFRPSAENVNEIYVRHKEINYLWPILRVKPPTLREESDWVIAGSLVNGFIKPPRLSPMKPHRIVLRSIFVQSLLAIIAPSFLRFINTKNSCTFRPRYFALPLHVAAITQSASCYDPFFSWLSEAVHTPLVFHLLTKLCSFQLTRAQCCASTIKFTGRKSQSVATRENSFKLAGSCESALVIRRDLEVVSKVMLMKFPRNTDTRDVRFNKMYICLRKEKHVVIWEEAYISSGQKYYAR